MLKKLLYLGVGLCTKSKVSTFLCVSLLLSLTACSSKPKHQPLPPVEVTVFDVEPTTIPASFDYVGFAQSSHEVEIRARVEGYLDKIGYIEGDYVKQGDLLFQLDPKPFIAALDNAKGILARQKAILWNATTTVNRLTPIYAQNAISKRDLDNATADQLAAEAQVQSAEAQVVQAQLNLGYTTITAAVGGLAGKARFREGALITTGSNAGFLTTLSVVDPMWVYFSVSETDLLKSRDQVAKKLLKLPENNQFLVQLILGDGTAYPEFGKVDFTAPILNQSTGTMEVRAVFPNKQLELKPGQFVKARVLGAVRPNSIFVPQQSVMQGQKGMYVYLVNKDNQAQMQLIEPGEWDGDYWIVTNGLLPGDKVIMEGVNKVQPGMTVKVTKTVKYQATTSSGS